MFGLWKPLVRKNVSQFKFFFLNGKVTANQTLKNMSCLQIFNLIILWTDPLVPYVFKLKRNILKIASMQLEEQSLEVH